MVETQAARESRTRTTRDLAVAGYLYMEGLPLRKAERRGREFVFQFEDPRDEGNPDGRWDRLHLDFANSACSRYDAAIRTLKKMVNREGAKRSEP